MGKLRRNMGGALPGDFITWLEVLLGGESDLLMCNSDSGYNYGGYLQNALEKASFSADEVNSKLFAFCGGLPYAHMLTAALWITPPRPPRAVPPYPTLLLRPLFLFSFLFPLFSFLLQIGASGQSRSPRCFELGVGHFMITERVMGHGGSRFPQQATLTFWLPS